MMLSLSRDFLADENLLYSVPAQEGMESERFRDQSVSSFVNSFCYCYFLVTDWRSLGLVFCAFILVNIVFLSFVFFAVNAFLLLLTNSPLLLLPSRKYQCCPCSHSPVNECRSFGFG